MNGPQQCEPGWGLYFYDYDGSILFEVYGGLIIAMTQAPIF